ncbi:LPS-assembly lipoprotein [Candidatus Liberibacter solanacearum]
MLSKKIYIASIISILSSCFFLVSCDYKIYPLYYSKNKDNTTYINPIKISVSSKDNIQEIYRNLNFLTSAILTKNKYQLNVNVISNTENSIHNTFFNNIGRIVLKANYSLKELSKGKILYKNRMVVTSLYSFTNQNFAKMRTIKNTETKAIKELAENIHIDIVSFIKNVDQ